MSFTPTPKVEEGAIAAPHVIFQSIKDNIYAIYDAIGSDEINEAAAYNPEHGVHALYTEGSFLTIFHTFRYLAYGSTGAIVDPSGIGDSITISDAETGKIGFYDLEGIDWLTYGMLYRVTGVTWCREVENI
jgi:hypothetical protein